MKHQFFHRKKCEVPSSYTQKSRGMMHKGKSIRVTTERSWIEATFHKRECTKFIPSARDEHRFEEVRGDKNAEYDVITTSSCCCGHSYTHHCGTGADIQSYATGAAAEAEREEWTPGKNTKPLPTDAYGTIEFQGLPHPTKAQYVRLAHDTKPEPIVQLLRREWNLGLPKLLITVHGGRSNFELQPTLKKVLRKGLLKAAKTTGAWIFTGGTNTGVTRQVGDALLLERAQRQGRVVSIGIAPWGILEKSHELVGKGREMPYESFASPWSKLAVLNNRHSYFLLVDNGTGGRYGAEIMLRRKLEKYISNLKLQPYTFSSIPVVALVIEGGTNTIRSVLEYVTDEPPVPVVVCDGSGRAADILAFMHKYAVENETDGEGDSVLDNIKDHLLDTIKRTFDVGLEQANQLYSELLQCIRKRHLITVFRVGLQDQPQELDQTILTALFRSQQLSAAEQLSLALIWNRVDIARSEIFVYGQKWPPGALEHSMMEALQHDRIDFVKLLLENGVSMKKFLTMPRLEELYNTKEGPTNTLGYILRDVRPHIPRGYMYTLHDIGLVINKLMGGAYRSEYTSKKFRFRYTSVMKRSGALMSHHAHRNSCAIVNNRSFANPGGQKSTMSLLAETLPATLETGLFDYPFNELLIWAVLTKRQQMALLMWQHGEEALAKALVASKLYKAMAHEAAEDDLETEVYEELKGYGREFENISLELLDFCYRQDDDHTQQLLTSELKNWSGQTCLSLAVTANHRALLAHACSQIILADLWMGGLRTRKSTNFKIMLGLICPFYIPRLEFKSREELQLMPQTAEEHLIALEDENEDSESETCTPPSPDVEKRPPRRSMSIRCKTISQQGSNKQALIAKDQSTGAVPKETIVHGNGKVHTDVDEVGSHRAYGVTTDYLYDNKSSRPLKNKKKLYEFYTAPITKFWANATAYVIFLVLFSYTILVRMPDTPSWPECFAIAYILTMGCEKMREIATSEPVTLSHKFSVWTWNLWNPCDAGAIIFFLIGLVLRLRPSSFEEGRTIYCVSCMYWYLRMLNILGVNKYLGPLVTMMGKMVKNMIYFVVLLLVVLMSFGVARQAILNPNADPNMRIVRDVFMEPYFMLYGEVYADRIDPECDKDPAMAPCLPGRWITPIAMSVYLLVANILLINLLIAVFNNIFIEVNAVAHQVWMFQRFTVVMEYEQKPVLPPPLIVVSHLYLLARFLFRLCTQGRLQTGETSDNGLKLFLTADDLERLYDFEEDCVEGYFREQEQKLQVSMEERVKVTTERVENMHQKIEDIDKKGSNLTTSMQGVQSRVRILEELNEQTLATLGVIHRFMATHMPPAASGGAGHSATPGISERAASTEGLMRHLDVVSSDFVRPRRVSERSEAGLSDAESHTQLSSLPLRRKKLLQRAMTDAAYLAAGLKSQSSITGEHDEPFVVPSRQVHVVDALDESGENVSVNESSVSAGDVAALRDESKDTTMSHDDSETGKMKELRNEPSEDQATSGEATTTESHQDSTELPSRQNSNSRTRSESMNEKTSIGAAAAAATATAAAAAVVPSASFQRGVTWAEPRVALLQSSSSSTSRSLLMSMRAEYTSITDELESFCGLLSPPRSPPTSPPPIRVRTMSERSQSQNIVETAWQVENKHLRNAEECDYQQMEDLIQRRYVDDDESNKLDEAAGGSTTFYVNSETSHPRLLRGAAIDSDDTLSGPRRRGLRMPPSINVTREIEHTLAQPAATRGSNESDPNDKDVAAPASETMC
ncbi:transient receptor potential cation channel trpm isoform X2 [Trichogramma pretiosum]|uniref:transient receptor potential cation channel trpm isoform X2 n=1 Tax=Trichogramma pretiosum TaxID=7493 RepID=UPI0006C9D73F|nr:transient receptor potential cation channel trpm isoform X2 [Trichogramma pretiosum]